MSSKPPGSRKELKDRYDRQKSLKEKMNASGKGKKANFNNVKSGSSTNKVKKNKYRGMSGKELEDFEFNQRARKEAKKRKR